MIILTIPILLATLTGIIVITIVIVIVIIHIHKKRRIYICNDWLVVPTPLKNISQLGMIIPYIIEKYKHVPNHQPDIQILYIYILNNDVMKKSKQRLFDSYGNQRKI